MILSFAGPPTRTPEGSQPQFELRGGARPGGAGGATWKPYNRNRIYYTGTHYAEQKRKGAFVKLRVDG